MHKIVRPDLRNLSFSSTNFAEGEEGTTHQCMNYGNAALAISICSFCSNPREVSDKNTQRNIFIIKSLSSFHKGSVVER
jgi:hypothetical protein